MTTGYSRSTMRVIFIIMNVYNNGNSDGQLQDSSPRTVTMIEPIHCRYQRNHHNIWCILLTLGSKFRLFRSLCPRPNDDDDDSDGGTLIPVAVPNP